MCIFYVSFSGGNMKAIRWAVITLALAAIVVMMFGVAQAETKTFSNVNAAIKYINKNKPESLTLENVSFKPSQLLKIRNAMSEGAEFHFTTTWGELTFSDDAESLDLRVREGGTNIKDLKAIVQLCPNIKYIDNSHKFFPSNNEMIPLVEQYPDIQFVWQVKLGSSHHISTNATVFSTMNHIGGGGKLTSKNMELLKYCTRLKALDLGHNNITSLDFLKYCPDLELLIIADNKVTDITPISQLKHLKYAEIFKNHITDLSPLASCTELLDLNITWCDVTDLSPLDSLTGLERLWANMMRKMDDSAMEHFKSTHPNTLVDYQLSHAATVDGWRDHERYKHYIWCFKNHKWIPFDEPLPSN